ncbi:hypothetical protein CSIM01_08389 [Colletotrichum simmondsii]|uniref:Uncharacterized protein n=1 Tax=Colletotrichum simmondsii TaxID=703756 RepID=A0A135SYB0_9PEZI|nr:hypothetical protein CSIM01_08389 [Colletotrichum simmondsii]
MRNVYSILFITLSYATLTTISKGPEFVLDKVLPMLPLAVITGAFLSSLALSMWKEMTSASILDMGYQPSNWGPATSIIISIQAFRSDSNPHSEHCGDQLPRQQPIFSFLMSTSNPSVGDGPFTTFTSVKARRVVDPRPQPTHHLLPKNGDILGPRTPTMPETQSRPMSPSNASRDSHPRTSDPAAQKKHFAKTNDRAASLLFATVLEDSYAGSKSLSIPEPPRARSTTLETQYWAQFP